MGAGGSLKPLMLPSQGGEGVKILRNFIRLMDGPTVRGRRACDVDHMTIGHVAYSCIREGP